MNHQSQYAVLDTDYAIIISTDWPTMEEAAEQAKAMNARWHSVLASNAENFFSPRLAYARFRAINRDDKSVHEFMAAADQNADNFNTQQRPGFAAA